MVTGDDEESVTATAEELADGFWSVRSEFAFVAPTEPQGRPVRRHRDRRHFPGTGTAREGKILAVAPPHRSDAAIDGIGQALAPRIALHVHFISAAEGPFGSIARIIGALLRRATNLRGSSLPGL